MKPTEPKPLDYSTPVPFAKVAFSWKRMSWAIALVLIAFACVYPFSQMHHMRQADAHAAIVKAQIASDPRFSNVHLGHGTQDNGCMIVSGEVAAQKDLNELKEIVTKSKPPVTVRWFVNVIP